MIKRMIKGLLQIAYLIPIRDRYRYDDVGIALLILIILSLFLRLYRLGELMPFIGDQGWFYLPARDMPITGNIPLVGPQTSHPWIHHGAHWTYILAIILWVFDFNPVPPAYFIAILGAITVLLLYKVASELFSKRAGLIVAFLYATSPLIVLNARMPYHTSPIPFFTIFLFYAVFKWMRGRIYYFPLITFLMGVLYNYELTTFVLFIPVFFIFLYGLFKKKVWAKNTLSKRIVVYSTFSFLIPMLPFIIYDTSHGYKQTLGFIVWIFYRVIKFPLQIFDLSGASLDLQKFFSLEFFTYIQQLIFAPSIMISLIILIFSLVYFFYLIYRKVKNKDIDIGYVLLFLYLIIPITGLFVHRVPIEADILLLSPFLIMVIAIFIDKLFSIRLLKAFVIIVGIGVIGIINSYYLFSTEYFTKMGKSSRITFEERMKAVDSMIKTTKGKPYNLVGRGELSDFPMFTMNYEYLLWWKGYPPTKENVALKIVVWEKEGDITIYQEQ